MHPGIERELRDVPIRESAPAFVVAHELPLFREALEERTPDRGPPVVLDVVQPVRGFHQGGAGSGCSKGEADAVRGLAEGDLLLHRGLGGRTLGPVTPSGAWGQGTGDS